MLKTRKRSGSSSPVRQVNLSGNVFEDGAYSPMGTALESSKTTTMRLEDMKIDPTTLDDFLGHGVVESSTFSVMIMDHNPVGDEGLGIVA